MSGRWSRTRFIGAIVLVLLGLSIVGGCTWLKYGPEHNVRVWIDKKTVQRNEPMTLYIRNLGSQRVGFGTSYSIYRLNENGTTTHMNRGWVWAAVGIILFPFGTWSCDISTDFDPGEYYVVKEYNIRNIKPKYTRKLYFTIK
jgi:hypothetical protein